MTKVGEELSETLTPGTKYVVIGWEPGNHQILLLSITLLLSPLPPGRYL